MITEEQIERLPRWARVSFAARCARRVRPLFAASWSDAPKEYVDALDRVVMQAERSAASAKTEAVDGEVAVRVARFLKAAVVVAEADAKAAAEAVEAMAGDTKAAEATTTAAVAAYAKAAAAAFGATADAAAHAPAYVARAAKAVADADATTSRTFEVALARDFSRLVDAFRRDAWTDDTPVPPEVFGPMWPDGVPDGWPAGEKSSEGAQLVFDLEIPDDASDEEVVNMVAELAERADSVHRAHGGNGLRVQELDIFGDVPVREKVSS